jgi:hypothetical protein
LDLPIDLHTKLRVLAAEADIPMSQYARRLVEEAVLKKYGKRAEPGKKPGREKSKKD